MDDLLDGPTFVGIDNYVTGVGDPQIHFLHCLGFAPIGTQLAPYRAELVSEASQKGLPLARHLMLHYPDDPEVYKLRYQWMYGSDFLVRLVLDPGVTRATVYLPAGKWVHLFSNKTYGNRNSGAWIEVDAPVGEELIKSLKARGVL